MITMNLLDALTFNPSRFPTVADVLNGQNVGPTVIIHAFRKGVWCSTVPVKAAEVQWEKLLPEDHVETVQSVKGGQ